MKENILHILRYFALFKHPLTLYELFQFLNIKTTKAKLESEVNDLIATGEVINRGRYLQRSTDTDFTGLRDKKEQKALKMIHSSKRYVSIISKFPFVKSVAISGSLSKLSAGMDADFDYFIVTSSNRLWTSRTLLHLFKKFTFVTGRQNCYCMNYFVDESHLDLPFQTYYTALELQTLIPVYGLETINQIKSENTWTSDLLPNHSGEPLAKVSEVKGKSFVKWMSEAILNLLFPSLINRWLMKVTDWKWRRKFASLNLSEEEYDQALMTRIHISKNHPHDFQKRILEAMDKSSTVEQSESIYA